MSQKEEVSKALGLAGRIGLLLSSTMTVMAGALVAPAIPAFSEEFSGPNSALLSRMVLTMPGLAVALSSGWIGILSDRFGKKNILLAGLFLYAFFGLSPIFLASVSLILVSRFFLGAAVAMIMTCSTALITGLFMGQARQRYLALQAFFMGLGAFVFLSLGGILSGISWRLTFSLYGSSLIVFLFVYFSVPKVARTWQSLGRQLEARLDWQFWMAVVLGFLGMLLFYLIPLEIPFFLRNELKLESFFVGIAMGVLTLASALTSYCFHLLVSRFGVFLLLIGLFLSMGIGHLSLMLTTSALQSLIGLMWIGVGAGILLPTTISWVTAHQAPSKQGVRIGFVTAGIFLGQFSSPFVWEPVREWMDYNGMFQVAALFSLFIAGALLFGLKIYGRRL